MHAHISEHGYIIYSFSNDNAEIMPVQNFCLHDPFSGARIEFSGENGVFFLIWDFLYISRKSIKDKPTIHYGQTLV